MVRAVASARPTLSPGGWPGRAADLGSGAGLPGLPLALCFTDCTWTLVESVRRRAEFLVRAVRLLGIADRVQVARERAEVVGRDPAFRGQLDLVVARSFGPPAAVAECAAPLLVIDGRVVVSEPPGGAPARWPATGLHELGMTPEKAVSAQGSAYQVVRQHAPCPDRYPRRSGVPVKRPLF
ncbi:MAG: 16S rRNA (guanine(527)-N(7))-methyltransferase RsmG [Acidimicrobiales bacterium]